MYWLVSLVKPDRKFSQSNMKKKYFLTENFVFQLKKKIIAKACFHNKKMSLVVAINLDKTWSC